MHPDTAFRFAPDSLERVPTAIHSTGKNSQNRNEADAMGVVAAVEAIADTAGAAAICRTRRW